MTMPTSVEADALRLKAILETNQRMSGSPLIVTPAMGAALKKIGVTEGYQVQKPIPLYPLAR